MVIYLYDHLRLSIYVGCYNISSFISSFHLFKFIYHGLKTQRYFQLRVTSLLNSKAKIGGDELDEKLV